MEYEGYGIVSDGKFGFKEIKAVGKGSVHLTLRGSYTNDKEARKAIDNYNMSKVAKGDKTD